MVPITHAEHLGATPNHALPELIRGPSILGALRKEQVVTGAEAKRPRHVHSDTIRVQPELVGTIELPKLEISIFHDELEGNVCTAAVRRVAFELPSVRDWG